MTIIHVAPDIHKGWTSCLFYLLTLAVLPFNATRYYTLKVVCMALHALSNCTHNGNDKFVWHHFNKT